MKRKQKQKLILLLALLTAVGSTALIGRHGRSAETPYYAVQCDAAARMQACMDAVKEEKARLGIALDAQDRHQTGMIGEEFNFITTTLGEIGAKRTTANPDMAALVVRLLHEAGIKAGDTVGAGFSGSFPSMNLAVINACAAMEVRLVYIASVGSSTYGANNPGLTFPEMAVRLYEDGLIPGLPAKISLGGGDDIGRGMDPEMRAAIEARLAKLPVELLREPDYGANLAARMQLYAQQGPIDCFIGVGGNLTTLGVSERAHALGQGLIKTRPDYRISEASGLIERYSAAGLPVINLLNIKKLMADYGMPFDPAALSAPGEAPIYHELSFAAGRAWAALALIAAFLVYYKYLSRPPRQMRPVK